MVFYYQGLNQVGVKYLITSSGAEAEVGQYNYRTVAAEVCNTYTELIVCELL